MLLKRGHLLLPLVALIVFLAIGYTPVGGGGLCVIAALVVSMLAERRGIGRWALLATSWSTTVRNVLPVVAAVAIAGMLIGVLTLTGMGLKLSVADPRSAAATACSSC